MSKLTIPEIRSRMHVIADTLDKLLACQPGYDTLGKQLHELAEATKRRRITRRAAPKRDRLTVQKAIAIRKYAAAHPSDNYDEIGVVFNVDGGRVSEALKGYADGTTVEQRYG